MSLRLNKELLQYQPYEGSAIKVVPNLTFLDRRKLMSIADYMDKRVEVNRDPSYKGTRLSWDSRFMTADAVYHHPDGRVKFVPDAPAICGIMHPAYTGLPTRFSDDGAVILRDGDYEAALGTEFAEQGLNRAIGPFLKGEEAKSNQFLQAVARNQDRLDAYVDYVISRSKGKSFMGIWLSDSYVQIDGRCQHAPIARALVLYSVLSGSDISERGSLLSDQNLFVGKLKPDDAQPGTAGGSTQTLDQKI